MIPFEDVLTRVRRTLQEAAPGKVQGFLTELVEARVLSWDFYVSLAQEGDADDVARRISLVAWQNWDMCRVAIGSKLGMEQDLGGPCAVESVLDTEGICFVDSVLDSKDLSSVDSGFDREVLSSVDSTLDGEALSSVDSAFDGEVLSSVDSTLDGEALSSVDSAFDGEVLSSVDSKFDGEVLSSIDSTFDREALSALDSALDGESLFFVDSLLDSKLLSSVDLALDSGGLCALDSILDSRGLSPVNSVSVNGDFSTADSVQDNGGLCPGESRSPYPAGSVLDSGDLPCADSSLDSGRLCSLQPALCSKGLPYVDAALDHQDVFSEDSAMDSGDSCSVDSSSDTKVLCPLGSSLHPGGKCAKGSVLDSKGPGHRVIHIPPRHYALLGEVVVGITRRLPPRRPGMQEFTVDLPMDFSWENILDQDLHSDDLNLDNIFSPNPFELLEDWALNQSIDNLIRSLSEEVENSIPKPGLPEASSSDPNDRELPPAAAWPGKKAADLESTCEAPDKKRKKTGPGSRARRRQQKSTQHSHSKSENSLPEDLPCSFVSQPAPQGVLQIDPTVIPQLVPVSISSVPPLGSTAFFSPCTNCATIQLIPAVTYPQQLINISMPSSLTPGAPTYIFVPPPPLTPTSHPMPQSPGTGAVVPSDFVMSTPVSSLSDIAFQTASPDAISNPSPISESPIQTSQVEPSLELPKYVEDYIQSVKTKIRETYQTMDTINGVSTESLYINVPLVQRQIQVKTGASKGVEKELVVLSDTDRKKVELFRSQLFEDMGRKPNQLIALLGKAGMGKTMFVRRLCLDWSNGDLPRFDYCFLLECKALNLPQGNYGLKTLLFDLSASPPCEDADAIFKHVLSVPQRVLIIFDGFDDFKEHEGLLHSPATNNSKENFSIKQLFSGLFQRKLLSGCTVLITARPKEVFNQFLGKVDRITELCGFSPQDVEKFVSEYFKDPLRCHKALKKLKKHPFTFSLCCIPLICRYTCFLLEDPGVKQLPSTFTGLLQRVIEQKLYLDSQGQDHLEGQQKVQMAKMCRIAWAGVKTHSSLLPEKEAAELKDFGLNTGIVSFYRVKEKGADELAYGFADPVMQNFLAAMHLVQSRDVSDKALVAQTTSPQKRRRPRAEGLDATRRFALGLLFQKAVSDGKAGSVATAKRGAAAAHLRGMKPHEMGAGRLLELCHCAYETGNVAVIHDLVKGLPDELTFSGVQLTPNNVFVLQHLLLKAKAKRTFSINLEETGIDIQGLKELLGMNCILSFRAPIADIINLWEDLQKNKEDKLLKSTVEKFTICPFKATQLCHVDDLVLLVQIYKGRKLPNCDLSSMEDLPNRDIFSIPAVRNLRKLELSLGSSKGFGGLFRLLEVLPVLNWLQHLDLEDNKIGDTGAEKLAKVLPALSSLEMLNLSQNCIGDTGMEKLAPALPSLTSLRSLSLYSNLIGDSGAEDLAKALPDIVSLTDLDVKDNRFTDIGAQKLSDGLRNSPGMKTVRMWNHYIPLGVLEHLKQQDSRIKSL